MMRRALSPLGVLGVATLAWSAPASGLMQPNGTVIPTDTEVELELAEAGDTVVPLTDAAITPETFRPECNLTFTVLQRLTDYKNSFGWYNVTGEVPDLSELYEFIHCDDPPNTWEMSNANDTSRTLSILDDPNYLGGEIGFFQAVPPHSGECADVTNPASVGVVMYSQPALNPEVSDPPYIHLIVMDSKVDASVFYFAWEDQLSGGDNDFSDLVLRVEGITCSGGGEACDSGAVGVCAGGITQCVNGELVCRPRQGASDELCNGLDDDCDGVVDNGDLCAERQICDRGVCIDRCDGTEFPCPAGTECREDGYCVDSACIDVICPEGQICRGGSCTDPCAGIVCPHNQECRAGRCVDPCAGVSCGENQACLDGACITTCECSGCPGGEVCDSIVRTCVEEPCAAVTCDLGTHCEAGSCVDNCAGAVCPPGQVCAAGQCEGEIVVDPVGAGGSIGVGGSLSGGGTLSIGGSLSIGGGLGFGGVVGQGATSSAGGASSDGERGEGDVGCGCRLGGSQRSSLAVALAGLGLVLFRRRRSKRR